MKKSRIGVIMLAAIIVLCVGIVYIVNSAKQYDSPYELTSTIRKEDIKSCGATLWFTGETKRIDIFENEQLFNDLLNIISFLNKDDIVKDENPTGTADVSLMILLKDGTELLLNYKNGVCEFVFDTKTAKRFGQGNASWQTQNAELIFYINQIVHMSVNEPVDKNEEKAEIFEEYEVTPISEIESNYNNSIPVIKTNYYRMSNNTWQTDNHSYKYMLILSGKDTVAAKVTTYYVLSNHRDITFEEAFLASGFSSNTADYFKPEEAVIVATQLTDPAIGNEVASQLIVSSTESDDAFKKCYYVNAYDEFAGDIYFDLTKGKFYLHMNMISSYHPYSEGTIEIIDNEIIASVDSQICYRFKILDENRIYFVQEGSIDVAYGENEMPILDGTTLTCTGSNYS